MSKRAARRPDPEPLQTNDERVVALGTAAWAVALLVLLLLRLTDVTEVPTWWLGMCGYGIVLGLFGQRYCRKRREAIARDAARGLPQRS